MGDETVSVITEIGIPSAAIIISTLVAVWLARSERRASAEARREEREQIAADRREDRIEGAFIRTLEALATLNTINLRAESAAGPFRELRVGLVLLDTAHASKDDTGLAGWFEAERLAGLAQARASMGLLSRLPENTDPDDPVHAGAPLNMWARDFANNLRRWRRHGATAGDLESLVQSAQKLH